MRGNSRINPRSGARGAAPLILLMALYLLASFVQSAPEVAHSESAPVSGARLPANELADPTESKRTPPRSLSPVPASKVQDAKPLDPAMLQTELRSYVQDIHHFTFKPNLMLSLTQVTLEESEPGVIFEYEVDAAYDMAAFRDGAVAASLMKRYCAGYGFEPLISNGVPAIFQYMQGGAIVYEQKIDDCELPGAN